MMEFLLICVFLFFVSTIVLSIYIFIELRKIKKASVGTLRIIEEEGEEHPHIFLELKDTSVFDKKISTVTMSVTHEKPSL